MQASDSESGDETELPDQTPGPSVPIANNVTVKDVHTIVIDCGMFSFIDVVGIKTLQNIVADYKELGIRVVFANCKGKNWFKYFAFSLLV